MTRILLEDTLWLKPADVEVVESVNEDTGDATVLIKCPFQAADVENKNGRVYPRPVLEKILDESSSVMILVKNKGLHGHLGHPKDGVGDDGEVTHTVTSLRMNAAGVVHGVAEINDTPRGKIIQEYKKRNYLFGISSRGVGSVNSEGVVQEDYELRAFDIVLNPSTPGATVKPLKSVTSKNTSETADTDATDSVPNTEPANAVVVVEDRKSLGGSAANQDGQPKEAPMSTLDRFKLLESQAKPLLSLKESDVASRRETEKTQEEILDLVGSLGELDEKVKVQRDNLTKRLVEKREKMDEWDAATTPADPKSVTPVVDAGDDKKVAEAEKLQTELDEAQKALEEVKAEAKAATELAEALKAKNDELSESLEEMTKERDTSENYLASAIEIISAVTAVIDDASVSEALAGHIENDSRLEEFTNVLARCESKEELDTVVEKLTESMGSAKKTRKRREEGHLPPKGTVVRKTEEKEVVRKEKAPTMDELTEEASVEERGAAIFGAMTSRNRRLEESKARRHLTVGQMQQKLED